jgi:prephenate dehydratase
MVAERQDHRYAAIASRLAGERYGLSVLAEGIQTSPDNATRFFLLRPGLWEPGEEENVIPEGRGKTTLIFSVEHQPGALVRALNSFARRHVNLARLESRPSRQRSWEYLFITDVEGYAQEPDIRLALRELRRLNPFVRILGSYPAAQVPVGAQ